MGPLPSIRTASCHLYNVVFFKGNWLYVFLGLLPHTDYRIEVKQQDQFERFAPQHIKISVGNEDVTDLKFVAFRKQSQFEISGNVITDYTYHKSLKVCNWDFLVLGVAEPHYLANDSYSGSWFLVIMILPRLATWLLLWLPTISYLR